MLRILEMAWLIIAIGSLIFGIWKTMEEGLSESVWFFIFTLIAAIMYTIRRRQRISFDKQKGKGVEEKKTMTS
ncbi:MAG: hypothetical protein ACR2GN_05665 [Bacteroidia bacterium]